MRTSDGRIHIPGAIHVVDRSPSAIRSRLSGRFDESLCRQYIALVDDWRGNRSGVSGFHDATAVYDYDILARDHVSRWLRECAPYFDAIHVLFQGRTLAWGLNIVSMISGANIVWHHSSAAFDAAFANHVARHR